MAPIIADCPRFGNAQIDVIKHSVGDYFGEGGSGVSRSSV